MPDSTQKDITPEPPTAPTGDIEGSAALEVSFDKILKALVAGYGKSPTDEGKERFAQLLSARLQQVSIQHQCATRYNILILFDNTTLIKADSDQIYNAINELEDNGKPLLLVVLSRGGESGPAYLIGQLCRESCNGKFVVAVPRYAKSAATLLACAADEIHMGSLSELGPIDPQINRMPALGLKNSIEHIAGLVNKMPESGNMFARYLYLAVEPIQIGYYERVAESSVQYAERLLESHKEALPTSPAEIAYRLVYGYKDHGFVIDKAEATSIFGSKIIKSKSPEYALSNDIYNALSEIENIADLLNYQMYFIGNLKSRPGLIRRKATS